MKPLHIVLALAALVVAYFVFFKKKVTTDTPSTAPALQMRVVTPSTKGKVPMPTGARVFQNRQDAVNYYKGNSGCSFVELTNGTYEVSC